MNNCKKIIVAALILLVAPGAALAQDTPGLGADRVLIKLEGQPVEIILSLPDGFCGIAWGTAPEGTGWSQNLTREERTPAGLVYSAHYSAEIDAGELLGSIRQDGRADIYYHRDHRTGALGLSLVALKVSGEDMVRQAESVLRQKYGEPSAVQEVHQDNEVRQEYCWYGRQTSIRYGATDGGLKATVVIFATKDLDI